MSMRTEGVEKENMALHSAMASTVGKHVQPVLWKASLEMICERALPTLKIVVLKLLRGARERRRSRSCWNSSSPTHPSGSVPELAYRSLLK
jgi:hypothetical protein